MSKKIPGVVKTRAKHARRGVIPLRPLFIFVILRTCEARVEGLYAPKYNNPVRVPQARSAGWRASPRHRRLTDAKGCKFPFFKRLHQTRDDTPHFATRYARRLVRGYLFALLMELRPVLRTQFYMSLCTYV